jgi:hypothetical protein
MNLKDIIGAELGDCDRIVSFEFNEMRTKLIIEESCDQYFNYAMNKEELTKLIQWLTLALMELQA